jgi:hypothetical protein
MFCVEKLPFGWSVSGPMGGLGCSERVLWLEDAFGLDGQRPDRRIGMFRECFVVRSCLFSDRSAFRWSDLDVQTVFCGEQLPFGWSVSGPIGGLGGTDSVLWCEAAFWLVEQRPDGWIDIFRECFVAYSRFWPVGQWSDKRMGIFRQCVVVSSCLLDGRSPVRRADWDVQKLFCGAKLPFGWLDNGPMGGLRYSERVFFREQLLLAGRSVVR